MGGTPWNEAVHSRLGCRKHHVQETRPLWGCRRWGKSRGHKKTRYFTACRNGLRSSSGQGSALPKKVSGVRSDTESGSKSACMKIFKADENNLSSPHKPATKHPSGAPIDWLTGVVWFFPSMNSCEINMEIDDVLYCYFGLPAINQCNRGSYQN